MIRPETPSPARWPAVSRHEDDERLDRALEDLVTDPWVDEFIKRLNYTIEDIGRRK